MLKPGLKYLPQIYADFMQIICRRFNIFKKFGIYLCGIKTFFIALIRG